MVSIWLNENHSLCWPGGHNKPDATMIGNNKVVRLYRMTSQQTCEVESRLIHLWTSVVVSWTVFPVMSERWTRYINIHDVGLFILCQFNSYYAEIFCINHGDHKYLIISVRGASKGGPCAVKGLY